MPDSERTAAEREAARLERERRRAAEQAAGAGDISSPPRPDLGGAADDGAWLEAEEEAPQGGPHPAAEAAPEPERPLGTRRVARHERMAATPTRIRERPAGRRAVGRHARRPPRAAGPRTGARAWAGRIAALVALVIAAAVIWFAVELFQPFHGSGEGSVTVTVPGHAGARQIGDLLARDGVISSGFFFELRATLAGDRDKLLSGTYHLRHGMSYGAVLRVLSTPPPAAKVTELTITPGRTRAGISALLRSQGIHGDYFQDTRHSPVLDPTAYGAPRSTPSLEGFLFPDTYQLRVPIALSALIADQLRRFRDEFATVSMSYAKAHHLTPYDVLIVASLVQAEAQSSHDMPLVASVIYNRLREHIMLGFDSTTRYATGNFSKPLTQSQLASRSPWNTRDHFGLPPTPINNPDLGAIQAAAHPARTNFLYFVSKPCSGALAFSATYSRFLHDVAAFNATQSLNGRPAQKPCH